NFLRGIEIPLIAIGAPSEHVIPNQRARWCGNPHRISGSLSSYRPFFYDVFRNLSTRSGTSNRGIATPVRTLVWQSPGFLIFFELFVEGNCGY
ncbi:MAG: hypothetical protein SPG79_03750, partial [Candidatus Faecousia sp.]|nr:hypothetical protein [Candidatus Faecousia sp.]